MPNGTVMADGARNQSGKGSASKHCAGSAATSTGARRRSPPTVKRVRSIGASSVSLPGKGVPARWTRRSSRDHDTGHFEASATYSGTSQKICERQWSDHRGNRHHGVTCLPAYSKTAWLSRIAKAAHCESISHIHLIGCSRRSSRRLTRFWSHVANAPSACA